jgi:hypothetical protein
MGINEARNDGAPASIDPLGVARRRVALSKVNDDAPV